MSATSKFPEAEAILAALIDAMQAVEGYIFPALTAEKVTDDGETFGALRCPWCESLVTGEDDLIAVDFAERWTTSSFIGDEDYDRERVRFLFDSPAEFGSTAYHRVGCCDKPVSLPEGWAEDAQ